MWTGSAHVLVLLMHRLGSERESDEQFVWPFACREGLPKEGHYYPARQAISEHTSCSELNLQLPVAERARNHQRVLFPNGNHFSTQGHLVRFKFEAVILPAETRNNVSCPQWNGNHFSTQKASSHAPSSAQ
ncbi:hypothetical protein HRR83_003221 [Exophiala dermatitidis]|uniref:Secreted protein n=1 Tax=Exophiala dermatitidis TaxID=5970 RepID=A0AAN6EV77_EXODE|nr:hypothetical protein HRR74_004622 [Exophiala dermatitidis]KAJ4521225.1 hypothetical protein HRR73_003566 [Exophiala dermatitidis]KAJ4547817.1 hypothetical protein HRR76_000440 [Exophiala dermatitidis]KAJ4553755.1 hypothetical protein HRR77_002129 [Exophiala dermatitidis]KAJ4578083.1 hypothetical protein HRR79_001401 [Exophiala dermatitidis]